MSKLNLDKNLIETLKKRSQNIADEVQKFIDAHTTTSTERTVVRLLA